MGQPSAPLLALPARTPVSDFRQQTRRNAVMLVAWLEAGLFFIGSITTYLLPQRQTIEWAIFLVIAALCMVFSVLLFKAQRHQDEALEYRWSAVLIVLGSIGFLQRIYFAFHGPLLQEPSIYVFRPILAFLPLIALAAMTLVRASVAILMMWVLWALTTVIALTGLLYLPEVSINRDGVVMMLLWLLVACPLYLLLLNTIPLYEDVLRMSETELGQVKATAAISEQLRVSEQRFRMAVKSMQVGIWEYRMPTSSENGRWWCSDRFFKLLGYQPDELPLTSRSLLSLMDKKQADEVSAQALKSLDDDDGFDVDLQIRVKNRRFRTFNIKAYWERDAEGKPVQLTGAISDIHDRIQTEDALLAAQAELKRLAYSDPLTAITNRRGFDERLSVEIARSRSKNLPLSLLIVDLDHFKHYNDLYGHLMGDEFLRVVAKMLQSMIHRPADLVARIGGEEFAVLLPETSLEGAMNIAHNMLQCVRELKIEHDGSPLGLVTCSIGVACVAGPGATEKKLFSAADKALYGAKDVRNEVRSAPELVTAG